MIWARKLYSRMTLVMCMKKGAPENKVIKLVYDFYENELGIVYDAGHKTEVSVDSVLSQLPTKIDERAIDKDRRLTIYSWGVKKDKKAVDCDLIFDLRKFQTKIDKDLDVHKLTGLSPVIQDSIVLHPKFLELAETILTHVESENPGDIAFICNHGKHRSVGWAELLRKLFYDKATVRHLCRKNWAA